MQSVITRLALFQVATITYIIVGVGTVMRIVRDAQEPPQALAVFARDYGVVLFLLPLIWLIAAGIEAHRPKRDTGDFPAILGSGIGMLVFLVWFAFMATMSAARPMTHVYVYHPATPVPARFKQVMEP